MPPPGEDNRPGTIYNREHGGNLPELIERHVWKYLYSSKENDYFIRPDQPVKGRIGASWNGQVFYVFTTSVLEFPDAPRGYDPFGVYARLEHGGSISKATAHVGAEEHEIVPEIDTNKSVEELLEGFTVKQEYVDGLGEEEWVYENLVIAGQVLTLIAMSGGGKTTFMFRHVVPAMVAKGYILILICITFYLCARGKNNTRENSDWVRSRLISTT